MHKNNILRLVQAANENWYLWQAVNNDLPIGEDFYSRYVMAKNMIERAGFTLVTLGSDETDSDDLIFAAVPTKIWNGPVEWHNIDKMVVTF